MQLVKEVLTNGVAGSVVTVNGWVRTRRDAKAFSFIEVNDGSCIANLQIVADSTLPDYQTLIVTLSTGSSISATGVLIESSGKGQRFELRASGIQVFNTAPADYVLQKKNHTFEFLRSVAHLRPRTNTFGAVARIRSALSFAVHTFFQERSFHYVHTPIITASDCEGAGQMFRVTTLDPANVPLNSEGGVDYSKDFFEKPAHLTVSGQLEGETYALALGRIYTFGPTFRAEQSNTARHLAEFWMIEPEAAFFTLIEDMQLAEDFVRYLAKYALDFCGDDIAFFNQRIDTSVVATLENIAQNGFERLSYTDAVKILESENSSFEYKVSWGSDLQSEHERHLTEKVFKKPVILYDYPREIKAFYMKLNQDGRTVRAMDVLVPRIGELIGGSEREDRFDVLIQRLHDFGLEERDYWWYTDLRKYGSVPHAGFGLGFERLMLLVTGMQNIRDVIPYPRFPGNAEF